MRSTSTSLQGSGGPVDHERALQLWQSSAKHGVTAAYLRLGTLYRKGQAVTQDMQRARRYYQRAQKVGDPQVLKSRRLVCRGLFRPDFSGLFQCAFERLTHTGRGDARGPCGGH